MDLLEVTPEEYLKCPHEENDSCDTFIADGTVLGPNGVTVKEEHVFDPKKIPTNGNEIIVGSRVERQMIKQKSIRNYFDLFSGISASGGKDTQDDQKHLSEASYAGLLGELNQAESDEDNCDLLHSLADFISSTHQFAPGGNVNCRTKFSSFFHELGNHKQSAIGFLQITNRSDRNFLVAVAHGEHESLLEKPDLLQRLNTISPLLHAT